MYNFLLILAEIVIVSKKLINVHNNHTTTCTDRLSGGNCVFHILVNFNTVQLPSFYMEVLFEGNNIGCSQDMIIYSVNTINKSGKRCSVYKEQKCEISGYNLANNRTVCLFACTCANVCDHVILKMKCFTSIYACQLYDIAVYA